MDGLDDKVDQLSTDMKAGFQGVSEAIDALSDDLDIQFAKRDRRLDNHDKQIRQLRHKAA